MEPELPLGHASFIQNITMTDVEPPTSPVVRKRRLSLNEDELKGGVEEIGGRVTGKSKRVKKKRFSASQPTKKSSMAGRVSGTKKSVIAKRLDELQLIQSTE